MNLSRLVPFCFLTIGLCAPICSAQANRAGDVPTKLSLTVSVRELSIPMAAGRAFDRGTQLLAARVWTGSISEFRKAIKAFPTFYEAFYNMGIAEERLGHSTEAESAFRKSLELSADRYAPAHFGLGLMLATEKQYAEAESMVQSGLAIDPKDGGGYYALAWIRYTTDRLPAAESSAREALLREPKHGCGVCSSRGGPSAGEQAKRRETRSGCLFETRSRRREGRDGPSPAHAG